MHKQISKNKIEIDRLKKDLKNKSIKNKIYERDAEISRLKQDSANLQTEISGIKAEKEIYGKQRYSEGQTELVASVEKRYSDKEFDDLLRTISMKMVEEDIKIVTSPRLKLKMQDMLTYFKAELLCSEPYNETKVNKAKEDLSKIDNQTQMVKDMVRKLDKYKIYTDGLKKKVHSIAEMVRVLTSLGDDEIVPRQAEIFSEILYYRKNYPDYTYPYLESIIDELIKRKAKDINDDISDLESKL